MASYPNVSQIYQDDLGKNMNDTNPILQRKFNHWNIYFDTTILTVIFVAGFIGNILVMKTTVKVETKFARQIMSLFFSLAMTDSCICSFRVGILIYILFHPSWDNGAIVCTLWFMSLAIVGIAIWQNLLVGVQRLFIVKAFPAFRKYCTIPLMVILIVGIFISQGLLHVSALMGFHMQHYYDKSHVGCVIQSYKGFGSVFYRIVVLGAFTVLPLVSAIVCHFWIVRRIVTAGLTKLQKVDDRDSFIKITKTALIRSFVLFLCFTPFLVASILDPYHDIITETIYRYLDYCLCAHSALSPFITLQDSDFGDDMPNKKSAKRNKKQNSMSVFNSSFRRIGVSVITSENLKTNRSTE